MCGARDMRAHCLYEFVWFRFSVVAAYLIVVHIVLQQCDWQSEMSKSMIISLNEHIPSRIGVASDAFAFLYETLDHHRQ